MTHEQKEAIKAIVEAEGVRGAKIKTVRTFLGYTQSEFADLVGVNQYQISLWESGKNVGENSWYKIKTKLRV